MYTLTQTNTVSYTTPVNTLPYIHKYIHTYIHTNKQTQNALEEMPELSQIYTFLQ